jgi:hypothetical protein
MDLVDEFGVLKAGPIQWRGVYISASRKSAIVVLPNIGISSLSGLGLDNSEPTCRTERPHTVGEDGRLVYSRRSNAGAAFQITFS